MGGSGRFLLACHPNLIKCALIARILFGDAFFYRLHALKAATRIEVRALLAGVQLESALRTLPFPRTSHSLQYRSTLRAARDDARPWQVHRFRPQCMIPARRTALALRRSLLPRLFFLARLSIAVLISRLTVFGQRNLPQANGRILHPMPPARQV